MWGLRQNMDSRITEIFSVGDWMDCKLYVWIWSSEDKSEMEY